jgi:hypothetical protein
MGVVAGLVPATSDFEAQSKTNRGGRTSPATTNAKVVQHGSNPV